VRNDEGDLGGSNASGCCCPRSDVNKKDKQKEELDRMPGIGRAAESRTTADQFGGSHEDTCRR
jgi:hypothetical protein